DRSDAHRPQLAKTVADARLDDVLEVDEADRPFPARDRERRHPLTGGLRGLAPKLEGEDGSVRLHRLEGPLEHFPTVRQHDSAHPPLRREREDFERSRL